MSLTQSNLTITIATFLKSRYKNPLTGQLDGLAVDEDGNFLHYNTIIDATFDELFKDMHLTSYVDQSFKKERIVVAEAISNNGVISANIEVGWKSRRRAVELINKCYDLDISVRPAETIQEFNLDKVMTDVDMKGGDVFDPE